MVLSSITIYAYDNNGNRTEKDLWSFVYNESNRLVEVSDNSTVVGQYTYNGLGQRATKTANNKTTIFIYDQQGNLIAEANDQDTIQTE